jgi:hypothetical protein
MDTASAGRAPEVSEKEREMKAAAATPESGFGGNESDGDVALAALRNISTSDPAHPIHWPSWKKWVICFVYCLLQAFVTLTSTTYVSAEFLIEEKFNVTNTQVIALGQSMFIVGTAIGPVFLGPLS